MLFDPPGYSYDIDKDGLGVSESLARGTYAFNPAGNDRDCERPVFALLWPHLPSSMLYGLTPLH